jgi:hypothetical protein
MRLFAPHDDPIRANDRLVHFYVRRFWWTRSVHIDAECRLCNKRREIKGNRISKEAEGLLLQVVMGDITLNEFMEKGKKLVEKAKESTGRRSS